MLCASGEESWWGRTEDVFDALHVEQELPLDLPRPDYGAGDGREVAHLGHVVRFAVPVLRLELQMGYFASASYFKADMIWEGHLVVQPLDVLLNAINKLRLILLNRTPNLRSHE